ncbi:nucleotide exchange factor GrpE [Ruminococcus sp. YE282]|jgi:molecular chaperone GrpE|uniref:nucleotide exchange factor GrpE n=1 Tax=Ruminococcus sp. YE282 TaxID=3158780 RepID=UPI00088A8311|nr:nucleotide exchange factor GrpE [Ruminococcus bromii]MEE3498015.1 nucleotide exchange factor GrpE [Ruminococcus bromii]SCY66385.1 molecular chaperone GrpE [Ruminococcus bromii]HCB94405.1 nucleotide exchange factor GrpE [Ruminococcus sp.]
MPKKNKETKEKAEETKTTEPSAEEKAEKTEEKKKDNKSEKTAALEEELKAQKDKYMRLAAEYDNYRKRTANEKLSIYDDATAKAVTELLPVADSVRMALENLKDASPEIIKGVELISNQLDKSFEKLKIESYGEIGDVFDPNIHNAISKIDSDELDKNTISQVFQKGYKIGDKIVRHAMVQVANCD